MDALGTDDLICAAEACIDALSPHMGADWGVRAGGLEWSCSRTLGHIVDALAVYSDHLATRAVERLPFKREVDPDVSIEQRLFFVRSQAAVLARVCEASSVVRAYHPAGMADATGFADHQDPWERMLWCNGRRALPDHERLTENWWWWCRPLAEWDGTAYTRTQPPAWS